MPLGEEQRAAIAIELEAVSHIISIARIQLIKHNDDVAVQHLNLAGSILNEQMRAFNNAITSGLVTAPASVLDQISGDLHRISG